MPKEILKNENKIENEKTKKKIKAIVYNLGISIYLNKIFSYSFKSFFISIVKIVIVYYFRINFFQFRVVCIF